MPSMPCPVSLTSAQALVDSCRGLDNRVYYMLAPEGQYYNYSGCGNTLNCNHPVVRAFILDALRYWVTEMHVDGFRCNPRSDTGLHGHCLDQG